MKNHLKTIALLGVLSAAFVAVGASFGGPFLFGSLVLAVAMNVGAYFFSDRLVLAMHHARELNAADGGRVHRIVRELSGRAGMPMPRVFIIDEPQPNAFATGRNPEHGVVAVTAGLLELLDERELRGVIAHELAHIKNRDILLSSIAATFVAALTYLAHAAGMFGALFRTSDDGDDGPSGLETLLLALFAPLAATLVQLGISRSREYLADETGAQICHDPEALARGLEKLEWAAQRVPAQVRPATASMFIVNPLAATQSILSLFSTHPRIEERVRRLRRMARQSGSVAVALEQVA